ncbi:MAG: hypothetical protein KGM98_12095 [Bacteroidota bacterium]|nr:hypothetical protein [Bacteroidota bacterium]
MHSLFKRSLFLKHLSAGFLLVIFSLAITPKSTLHQWFANHKDSTARIPGGKSTQYTKAGIICHCQNLVAESHFLEGSSAALPLVASVRNEYQEAFCDFITITPTTQYLRGPPSL